MDFFIQGGLGVQILGLGYCLWIKENIDCDLNVVFLSSDKRPFALDGLVSDINYQVVTVAETRAKSRLLTGQILPKNIRKMLLGVKQDLLNISRFRIHYDHLEIRNLQRIRSWTRTVHGYNTDWKVLDWAWPELQLRMENAWKYDFRSLVGSESGLSIHWRLGDYLNDEKARQTHGVISPESMKFAINSICRKFDIQNISLYSDDIDRCVELLGIAEEKSNYKLSVTHGSIIDDLKGITLNRFILGSHSSISLLSSMFLLKSNGGGRVFLPDKWFNDTSTYLDKSLKNFRHPSKVIQGIQTYPTTFI